ncbi:type III effector protein XopY [Xanthomonas translucens]|uniref:type III effector protein XopY n=1 Tax=Xanthomonas campestris pv. translucens TaxID=343 RepID=UPI00083B9237|nr:type III effector protein XopY [Xanthomonas translucens]WLA00124.1 type III effector protein XopY [Xanthomonas translucens]
MRLALPKSRLSKTAYADDGAQAHSASSSTLPSPEHGHAPVAPDLPRAPRPMLSKHESLQRQPRRYAQYADPTAALPLPPTNMPGLMQEISEEPHEGPNAAAGIERSEHALSVAETSQGSASAQPLHTPDILHLMREIYENDLHDGPELAELAERIEREGKRTSQHSAPATAPTNPDISRLLQAVHEKNSAQGNALAALVEQIERSERESATARPNPDVDILLQQIRQRVPDQASALAELVERSERPSPDRKTTCFPLFRRARP